MKRIYFLFPCLDIDPSTKACAPVGGFKVLYEYANRLATDGFEVILVYPHFINKSHSIWNIIRAFLGFCYRKIFHLYKAGEWFNLDNKIKKAFVFKLAYPWLKFNVTDTIIASAYETAIALSKYKNIPKKNQFYFIQDYETWAGTESELSMSYKFGMHNITIAPWLKETIEKSGAKAHLIYNGFNLNEFSILRSIENRSKYEIIMLNHKLSHKRCQDSWAALKLVKAQYPQIHVSMFGTCDPPQNMPSWYTYYQNPSKELLRKIYNNGSIYIAASDFEGFGLTVGEAMLCGCAIACTKNGGFCCMAINEKTALTSKIYDVENLANNVIRYIKDDDLRINIAKEGNKFIKKFTWENSYETFKKIIINDK